MAKVKSSRSPNMAGFKSGKLTALERVGSKGGAALWRCRCDCGGVALVTTTDLRRGKRKSCGCSRQDFLPKLEPVVGVDPVVKFIFEEMNRQRRVQREVARKAGHTAHVMRRWRIGECSPNIQLARAVLEALGYELVIKEKK